MKKITVLLSLFFAAASASAQLTQANHAPVAGDTYQMNQCDSTGVTPGPGGSNMTWNYTMATHSTALLTYSATAASNPQYPSATVSVTANNSSSNTMFFASSANSLLYYGGNVVAGAQVAASLTYTAPAVYAKYPMSMGTSSVSTTGGSVQITSPLNASGTFVGSCTVTADGTGTLNLPGHTYNNIIRVMTTQTLAFTTNLANGTMSNYTYDYYEMGTKAPVFSIMASTAVTPLGTSSQTLVMRAKPAPTTTVGIENNGTISSHILIFPNPASDVLNFMTTSNSDLQVHLFDLTGQLVRKGLLNGSATISTSDLRGGIYFYEISDPAGLKIQAGKVTVTK